MGLWAPYRDRRRLSDLSLSPTSSNQEDHFEVGSGQSLKTFIGSQFHGECFPLDRYKAAELLLLPKAGCLLFLLSQDNHVFLSPFFMVGEELMWAWRCS